MLVCADRHASFRDSDLFAAVAVLEHFVERGSLDAALAPTLAAWRDAVARSGPGTIDLDLDAVDADPPMRMRLADALLDAADRAASEWQDGVPLPIINRFDPRQVKFSSYSVSDMTQVLLRLHGLLVGARC
jgi:hypothetical protein